MSLIAPKRLFHVPTMSTIFYEDVRDDVKNKGYVAVSHVWGEQKMYFVTELGIKGGVTWKIPLSSRDKIARLRIAMNHYKMEYCWWDVLCMPQDKQDEINLEIPYMGDYYSGASITLVLSDEEYFATDKFGYWYMMMSDIVKSDRNFTLDETNWIANIKYDLLDFSKEQWFKRVWTYQEAILSEEVYIVDIKGAHIPLSDIANFVKYSIIRGLEMAHPFLNSMIMLSALANFAESREDNTMCISTVLNNIADRNCYEIRDRLYGVLGILGYKNFHVDYNMNIDDINKKMVQYAYSKGDLSWMAIGGNVGTNFLQPMYISGFPQVLIEDTRNIYNVIFKEDYLSINVRLFGTIVLSENIIWPENAYPTQQITRVCKKWGLDNSTIFHLISDYGLSDTYTAAGSNCVDLFLDGFSPRKIGEVMQTRLDRARCRTLFLVLDFITTSILRYGKKCTLVKIKMEAVEKYYVLMVSGDAKIGDKIMLPRPNNCLVRYLGIVSDKISSKRKGVCAIPETFMDEYPTPLRYNTFEFPL
jgi:hypothetical protein